jgi:hypothetical protein
MQMTVNEAVARELGLPKRRERVVSQAELERLRQQTGIDETVGTAVAAGLLGCKPETLRRWGCDGPIKPVRLGNRLRWKVSDIQRALSAGEAA